MERKSFFKKFRESFKRENLRNDLLAGLIVLGPVVLTLYILSLIVSVFGNFFAKILSLLPFIAGIPPFLKTLIGLVIGIFLIYITGLSVRLFFGIELEKFFDRSMSRIPIVKTIYNAARELVKFVGTSQEKKLTAGRVAIFTLSDDGPYLMGFVTRDNPLEYGSKRFYTVFMPTTPNPTTGFYLMVEEDRLSFVDIDFNEAFKIIMTAGISISIKGGENIKNGLAQILEKVGRKDSKQGS